MFVQFKDIIGQLLSKPLAPHALGAGFGIRIPNNSLMEGNYQVGVLITHGPKVLGFQYTGKQIKVVKTSDWLSIDLPKETNNIKNYFILNESDRAIVN